MSRTATLTPNKDAGIAQCLPTTNYDTSLWLGKNIDGDCFRVLMQFNVGSIPTNAQIISAKYCLNRSVIYWPISIYVNTGSWVETSVTWNTAPSFNATPSATVSSLTDGDIVFNDVVSVIANWVSGVVDNYGFTIKPNDESTVPNDSWMQLNEKTGDSPQLIITYTCPPSVPTNLSPSTNYVYDATGAQQFSATYSDPDGDPMSAYQIQIANNTTGATVIDTGWVTASQLVHTVAAGTLANGTTYKWRVRTKDSYSLESAWSEYVVFSCQAVPSVTITAPTAEQTLTSQAITCTHSYASAGSFNQLKYKYEFKQGDTIIHSSGEITGQGNSYSTTLSDGAYTLYVTVWDTNELSNVSSVNFTILTTQPYDPINVTATFNESSASVTVSFENPPWKTTATEPVFAGTGTGYITQPTTEDGVTLSGDWEATVTTADKNYLTMGCIYPTMSYQHINISVDGEDVADGSIGTEFTYNGCAFTITEETTDPLVDGDKFTWETYAHKPAYNRIKRRAVGETEWIIANSQLIGLTWTDYTVAAKHSYEYSVETVDDYSNVSEGVVSSSVSGEFDNFWVIDQDTGASYKMSVGDKLGRMTSEREREEYIGQNKYPRVAYSPKKAYRGRFQFVLVPENGECMADKVKELRDLIDAEDKHPLIFKTFSGDVYYCDIYDFTYEPYSNNEFGRIIAFELVEVGDPEDVFS